MSVSDSVQPATAQAFAAKVRQSLSSLRLRMAERSSSAARRTYGVGAAIAAEGPQNVLKRWLSTGEGWLERLEDAQLPAVPAEARPAQLHFEYLRGAPRVDALLFAQGYAAKHHNSKLSWYGVFPFQDGFLVELHDGGAGLAYSPALIQAFSSHISREAAADEELPVYTAVLKTSGTRDVMVEISMGSLVTLVMPEGTSTSSAALERGPVLQLFKQNTGKRAMRVATIATGFSVSVLGLTLLLSPGAHVVQLPAQNIVGASPLSIISQPVPPDQRLVGLSYAGDKWEVQYEPRKANTVPSLKNVPDKKKLSNVPKPPVPLGSLVPAATATQPAVVPVMPPPADKAPAPVALEAGASKTVRAAVAPAPATAAPAAAIQKGRE